MCEYAPCPFSPQGHRFIPTVQESGSNGSPSTSTCLMMALPSASRLTHHLHVLCPLDDVACAFRDEVGADAEVSVAHSVHPGP